MSGRITEIRRVGVESPRVVVFVDGREAFTVSEQLAAELDLTVGRSLAATEAEHLGHASERERAREAALRLLAVRARSESELRSRLRKKGFGTDTTNEVVEALAEVGLVDDSAFARAWADERVRLRPVGPRRLTQELLAKGVDRELTARVVADTFDDTPELELAMRAVSKKARPRKGEDATKRRARLQSFLVRRGFSYEVASEALRILDREAEGDTDA